MKPKEWLKHAKLVLAAPSDKLLTAALLRITIQRAIEVVERQQNKIEQLERTDEKDSPFYWDP